jgi:hypothetical protein
MRNERYFLIFKGDAERAERCWRDMGRVDAALLTGLDLTRAESSRSEDLSREVVAFAQRQSQRRLLGLCSIFRQPPLPALRPHAERIRRVDQCGRGNFSGFGCGRDVQ